MYLRITSYFQKGLEGGAVGCKKSQKFKLEIVY